MEFERYMFRELMEILHEVIEARRGEEPNA